MRTSNSSRTSSTGSRSSCRSVGLLASVLFAVTSASAGPPIRVEGGVQLDVYSERYGGGDLFAELDDVIDPDAASEDLRIRSDQTLPGVFARFRWQPDPFRRYVGVRSEANADNATTQLEARWEGGLGRGWSGFVDDRLRIQQEFDDDEATDVVQTFWGAIERDMPVGELRLSLHQEHSSVDGDSLSRIYDYDTWGGSVRLLRRMGDTVGRATVDVRHRQGSSDYSGDRVKATVSAALSRFSFDGPSFDVDIRAVRRSYDGSGVISPSDRDGELTVRWTTPIDDRRRVITEGRYRAVVYDDPDDTFVDSLEGDLGARIGVDIGSLGLEFGGRGEWVRPQTADARAYDEGALVAKANLFAGAGLWIDVEESIGARNYHGDAASSSPGSLSFTTSDFVYSELSLLLGARWRNLTADVFGQFTVEAHDVDADDVSYFFLNARVGARY